MINLKDLFLTEGYRIGGFNADFTVRIEIEKTDHSDERQYRHGARDIITDEQITQIVQLAHKKILEALIFGKVEIQGTVVIKKIRENINIVCRISERAGRIEIVVITVMKKPDFRPKSNDFVIQVV